ncbi:MAG: copper chaperone PCu(A)C [Pseudomonadota bacterium]
MLRSAIIIAAALIAPLAFAHDYSINGVTIDHPWSRATPPGAKVAAGYMQLVNNTDAPVTLLGGSADFAEVELHDTSVKDGVMTMVMRPDGITVAPGDTVTFEPGGLHIMFTRLKEPLAEGETRSAVLDFGDAGKVAVDFNVAAMGATHHHESMGNSK